MCGHCQQRGSWGIHTLTFVSSCPAISFWSTQDSQRASLIESKLAVSWKLRVEGEMWRVDLEWGVENNLPIDMTIWVQVLGVLRSQFTRAAGKKRKLECGLGQLS